MTRLTVAQRIRFGLLFAAFEGGMPVIGLLVGVGLGRVIGGYSEYVAIAALAGLGFYMLFGRDEDDERAQRLVASTGMAMIVLGLSVSLDELAIGFGLGDRIGEATREGAEKVAAAALILIAAALLVAKILGH